MEHLTANQTSRPWIWSSRLAVGIGRSALLIVPVGNADSSAVGEFFRRASQSKTVDAREPSAHVGIPRVLFVAGAGFEPATFGL